MRFGPALFVGLMLLAAAGSPGRAAAEPSASCPEGNLLAGLAPVAVVGVEGDARVATDGRVTPEGAAWRVEPSAVLAAAGASITWDLGAALPIAALLLQADANDVYAVEASLDGGRFERLISVSPVAGVHGLRTRALRLAPRRARFVRLAAERGDGAYSFSELQLFCRLPEPWPPALLVVEAPLAEEREPFVLGWNDVTSRWWELLLAAVGCGLVAARNRFERRGEKRRLLRSDRLLAVAGLIAVATYFNFGAFHFGGYIHGWDTFHYYVGSKYFRELGYERIYECVAVADSLEPAYRQRVTLRKITNLRTNVLEPAAGVVAEPQRCTDRFTAERWREFRHDVAWFRAREAPERWDDLSTDHGYNATPVWNLAGSLLANSGPATDGRILALTLIDPLYFLALAAVVVWAFGWRTAAVALLVFGTYFPSRFFWTGGAFLRWDWLFYTVAAVACLRKGRPLLAGAAFGYAALLRVFPVLLGAGPALALGMALAGSLGKRSGGVGATLRAAFAREPARSHARFFAGAAVAALLLLPASAVVAGGTDAFAAFVANTQKHRGTPLTNNMGLRTVLTYRPSEIGRRLVSDAATDPWLAWKEARLAAWRESRLVALLFAAGALVLIGLAVRRHSEPWLAAVLGLALVAFAVELTSYYYAFLIVPALLWCRWRATGPLLLALAAVTQLVSLAPLAGMPTWRDEQYTGISLATVGVLALLLVRFARAGSLATDPAGVDFAKQGAAARRGAPRPLGRP